MSDVKLGNILTRAMQPNPWNPNHMDEDTMNAEWASIARFGFIDPVTVRRIEGTNDKFEIIDGEHRWRVAIEKEIESIPAVDLGIMPDKRAKELTIVLNELKGKAKKQKLAELVKDIAGPDQEYFELAEVTPFSAEDLELMVANLDPPDPDGDGPGGGDAGGIRMLMLQFSAADMGVLKERLHKIMVQQEFSTQPEAVMWLTECWTQSKFPGGEE